MFDVNKQKTSDSLTKTAKEGLSACDNKRSSGIDQPKFDMIQPKTAPLREQTDKKDVCFTDENSSSGYDSQISKKFSQLLEINENDAKFYDTKTSII